MEIGFNWEWFGICIFLALILFGMYGWIKHFSKKTNLRWKLKYGLFRKKYNEDLVAMIMQDIEAGVDENELVKSLIISNKATTKEAEEITYIYDQIKKRMKGGIKNE